MLPLSAIAGMARSVVSGRSPVADAAAAAWGWPPGAARHWRSSANFVFAIMAGDGVGPSGFLRLVPTAHRPRARVQAVAALVWELSKRGLPVAEPIPSDAGNLVETVSTPLGDLHAMVVRPAEGVRVDIDDLTPSLAQAWGAALARLHHEPAPAGPALPVAFDELDVAAFAHDPPLAAAVRRLADRLGDLPRDPGRFGVVHGDFELDNLTWRGEMPTVFDFDEAARSWFVADIAFAVRDLGAVPARAPTAASTGTRAGEVAPLFAAFLAGYRQVGPLDEHELAHLPLFAALHAASGLARLAPVLDAGAAENDPDWLVALRRRLDQHLLRLRAAVLAWR